MEPSNLFIYNIFIIKIFYLLVYTIAYGAPEIKDSKEGLKIAFGTLSLIGVAAGLFAFARSFGKIFC